MVHYHFQKHEYAMCVGCKLLLHCISCCIIVFHGKGWGEKGAAQGTRAGSAKKYKKIQKCCIDYWINNLHIQAIGSFRVQ